MFTHKKALAAAFLIAIFYIGSATAPSALARIGELAAGGPPGIPQARKQIASDYQGMLDFEHPDFRGKGLYINLNGLMARAMGQRYMNEQVKLDNGHLTALYYKRDPARSAEQMAKLRDRQEERGKAFLFVATPCQIPKYDNVLPTGYYDYSNQNIDALLGALREKGVPAMDLREELRADGISNTDAFFVTDVHWKPETGFWAYAKIVSYLEQAGLIAPIDPMYTDIDEFNIEVLEGIFLGSSGNRTGKYYAGVDDLSLIAPGFKTDISVEIPSMSMEKQGEFADVAINRNLLGRDYFTANPYRAYGHGNRDFISYRNAGAPIGMKAMAIGDSFSNVPFAFLSLAFAECDQLDMRYYEGDFEEYYDEYGPDIVIVMVYPDEIDHPSLTFDFFGDLEG